MCPPTAKAADGKLRLMDEGTPPAWRLEQAGGQGGTGRTRILGVTPSTLHQRVPAILGSTEEVSTRCRRLAAANPLEA